MGDGSRPLQLQRPKCRPGQVAFYLATYIHPAQLLTTEGGIATGPHQGHDQCVASRITTIARIGSKRFARSVPGRLCYEGEWESRRERTPPDWLELDSGARACREPLAGGVQSA